MLCVTACADVGAAARRCESEALGEALDELHGILKGTAPLGPAWFTGSPPLRDFGCPLSHGMPFRRCTPKQQKGGAGHAAPRVGPHASA